MRFIEYQFPKEISFGSTGGLSFHTDIIETNSGIEYRNSKWSIPKARYNVAIGIRHQADLETIRDLHVIAKGRFYGFRYHDPLDHHVFESVIGIGDGIQKEFQLMKRYQISESHFFDRLIFCPCRESLCLFSDINWVLLEKGKIQFQRPPPKGLEIKASFHFDVPVRFDCDFLPQRLDTFDAGSITDIPLVEIML